MRTLCGQTLGFLGLASMVLVGCSSPMSSNGTPNGASSTGTVANTTDSGVGLSASAGPLRCAPTPGMLDACAAKASGDACALSGKRDGGWTLPGSCRSTLDGAGLACVPTPPGPPSFLVNACSGKATGGACTATGPAGRTFDGTCRTGRANGTLFCGRTHEPPVAVLAACSGKAAGDACSRPEHKDGGAKPGVCRAGPSGDLACRPSEAFGTMACAQLDAGATCTLGAGHRHGEDGLTGSCVVPAAGGAATCVVSCADLFHRFHHHHRFGGRFGGGSPWWKHGHSDAGSDSP